MLRKNSGQLTRIHPLLVKATTRDDEGSAFKIGRLDREKYLAAMRRVLLNSNEILVIENL